MSLVNLIKKEKVTLIDKALYFDKGREIENNYHVWPKIEGRKSILNKGIISLVQNDRMEKSFREAFELKYNQKIPITKQYNHIIKYKIECVERCSDEKYY